MEIYFFYRINLNKRLYSKELFIKGIICKGLKRVLPTPTDQRPIDILLDTTECARPTVHSIFSSQTNLLMFFVLTGMYVLDLEEFKNIIFDL